MATETIKVRYVNQPKEGKNFGSLKDANNKLWGIHQSKLGSIETGKSYQIEYTTKDINGTTYYNIQKIDPVPTPSLGSVGGDGSSEMMFITGCVGRALGSGKFEPTDIKILTLAAHDAWLALQLKKGGKSASVGEPGLDDEIPY